MPIKKWIAQYLVTVFILFIVFSVVQYFKGHDIDTSVRFGVMWALISTTIFFATRIYNYRKNIHCAVCNDLSETGNKPE